MRAIPCGCEGRLEAGDHKRLVGKVLDHWSQGYPYVEPGENRVVRSFAARSYPHGGYRNVGEA